MESMPPPPCERPRPIRGRRRATECIQDYSPALCRQQGAIFISDSMHIQIGDQRNAARRCADLLDAVDAPLVGLGDVQRAQVGQGDGLGGLQGGAHRRPPHQVVVDAWDLAVDGAARHDAHLVVF
ncbi:hypothetical protein EYF80_055201 [Liparis tanakae]|uniref:Uncharacterized protein n=1 Tax=Liparis tanakae TaxID=230148 RepID=A0A4Z2F0B0_9TELE|nr:hypothetical protein EYF80_055201 [Liparis tanakae]